MKYLVCGAGTIGTTYAYLLSQVHDVDMFVKYEQVEKLSKGVVIALKNLAKNQRNTKKRFLSELCDGNR